MEKNDTSQYPIFDDREEEKHSKMTIDMIAVSNVDDVTAPESLKIDKNKFHTFGSEEARAIMKQMSEQKEFVQYMPNV